METIPCSAWAHAGAPTQRELGYCEGGEGGGYDTCVGLPLQWRTAKSQLSVQTDFCDLTELLA